MSKNSIAKEKGGLRVLIYALLLFIAGVALWQSVQNKMTDIYNVSSKLNDNINTVLLHSGFKDSDIVSQISRENKNSYLKWISFEKEINVTKNVDFNSVSKQLNVLIKQYNLKIVWSKLEMAQKMEIFKQNNLMLSIKFNFKNEKQSSVKKSKLKHKSKK